MNEGQFVRDKVSKTFGDRHVLRDKYLEIESERQWVCVRVCESDAKQKRHILRDRERGPLHETQRGTNREGEKQHEKHNKRERFRMENSVWDMQWVRDTEDLRIRDSNF